MLERRRLKRRNLTRTATVLLLSIALGGLSAGVHAEDAKQAGSGDLAAAAPDQSPTESDEMLLLDGETWEQFDSGDLAAAAQDKSSTENGEMLSLDGETRQHSGSGDLAAAAQDKPSAGASHADLAKQATDPTAILTQLQLQNIFVPSSNDADGLEADGYANQFIIQPVIPIGKSENFPLDFVLRPTLPILTTPDLESKATGQTIESDTTDLGDLSLLTVFLKTETWGKWGFGPAMTIPTATDKRTGASKWQAGPAMAVITNSVPNWMVGVVAWNQTSFASSRSGEEDVNELNLQIAVVRHFPGAWYAGWGDQPMTFDWKRDGHAEIPLNVRVGHVFKIGKQPVNAFVQPFYTIDHAGAGSPDWGFKVNLTLLFPELKWQF